MTDPGLAFHFKENMTNFKCIPKLYSFKFGGKYCTVFAYKSLFFPFLRKDWFWHLQSAVYLWSFITPFFVSRDYLISFFYYRRYWSDIKLSFASAALGNMLKILPNTFLLLLKTIPGLLSKCFLKNLVHRDRDMKDAWSPAFLVAAFRVTAALVELQNVSRRVYFIF